MLQGYAPPCCFVISKCKHRMEKTVCIVGCLDPIHAVKKAARKHFYTVYSPCSAEGRSCMIIYTSP